MASRQNRDGRGNQFSGVLGNVYKPTPNPAQDPRRAGKRRPVKALTEGVDTPAAETRTVKQNIKQKQKKKKGSIWDQARTAVETRREQQAAEKERIRAEKYPTTSPGVGQTAYRPGYTDEDAARAAGKTPKRKGLFANIREQLEAQRAAQNQPPPMDPTQVGIRESLGSAYVDPRDAAAHARRGFARPGGERRPPPGPRGPGPRGRGPRGQGPPRMSTGLQGPTERTMAREDAVAEATPLDEAGTPQRQGGTNTVNQPRSPRSRSRRIIR